MYKNQKMYKQKLLNNIKKKQQQFPINNSTTKQCINSSFDLVARGNCCGMHSNSGFC